MAFDGRLAGVLTLLAACGGARDDGGRESDSNADADADADGDGDGDGDGDAGGTTEADAGADAASGGGGPRVESESLDYVVDFETGDASQVDWLGLASEMQECREPRERFADCPEWYACQTRGPNLLIAGEIDGYGPRAGRFFARILQRHGEWPGMNVREGVCFADEHFELVMAEHPAAIGEDTWHGFSLLVPSSFTTDGDPGVVLMQYHHVGPIGSSPLYGLRLESDDLASAPTEWMLSRELDRGPGVVTRFPLELDLWTDFVIHAVWSEDPAVGMFQLWKNGALVYEEQDSTLDPGSRSGPNVHWGLYHRSIDDEADPDLVAYSDEVRLASGPSATYCDVAPVPADDPSCEGLSPR